MSKGGYWERAKAQRLSRRRALIGAAGVGAGVTALSLVGCGGGSSNNGGGGTPSSGKSSLITKPVDTTSQAKAGGTFKTWQTSDIPTMDPIQSTSFAAKLYFANYCYSRLVKFKLAKYPASPDGSVEGDLMQNWETSSDKLTITMHLRPGMKWDPRSPTNGRPIDAEDVKLSLDRFAQINPQRGDIMYDPAQHLTGPVESYQQPDASTIILKLKYPDASLLPNLAAYQTFWVLPKESQISGSNGFDPKGTARGYGPWTLESYTPSQGFTWAKNPDYYMKGLPYPDKLEQPIVTEHATALAEFKAGNIWNSVVNPDDILQTHQDAPNTQFYQADSFSVIASPSIGFGFAGDSPWKDQRMRQAINYMIDREAMIDALGNRQQYDAAGLTLSTRYHTIVGAGWEGYWLDPTDQKAFGANSKYFKFDLGEAKKLMSAAGFANGVDTTAYYNGSTSYGPLYTNYCQTIAGLLNDGGVRAKLGPSEYPNDWLPNYHYAYSGTNSINDGKPRPLKGFNGLALRAPTPYPTPAATLFANQHKDGSRFEGASLDGSTPAEDGDPQLNSMIDALRSEFDVNAAHSKAQDIARYVAEKAHWIQGGPFAALGFTLVWPVIGNYGAYRTWVTGSPAIPENVLYWWIDTSKPPVGKA